MKKLIALYPILYQSKQYSIGEELPTNNNEMIEKWVKGSSAKWIEEYEDKNSSTIDAIKEKYEKSIAEIKEMHKAEIDQLKSEKEEAINKYNDLLKLQMPGKIEEETDLNNQALGDSIKSISYENVNIDKNIENQNEKSESNQKNNERAEEHTIGRRNK